MYDGSGLIEVLRGHEYLSHPFAVTMYGGEVYWTDWRTNTLAKANKWTGHNVTVVQRTNTQPFDLQVYHPSRQPQGRLHSRYVCINIQRETEWDFKSPCQHIWLIWASFKGERRQAHSSLLTVLIHYSLSPKTADLSELWDLLSPHTSGNLDTSCCPVDQKVTSLFDISHRLGRK